MNNGTIELQGKSIKLRRYRQEDIETIYEKLGCDPEMMRYTGWNPYHSLESTAQFIAGIIDGYDKDAADYSWIVELNGAIVGIIGAYDFNEAENSIEIGYSIFKEFWGGGLASEATALACRYLMDAEGIAKLKAWSAQDNIGSTRVLEKAGFVRTETKESALDINGTAYDQVFFEKIR